jgi:4-hydroxy-tetrahydrodipicolinate reductase
MQLRVIVTGACGRMGQEVIRTILRQQDMELVGAIEKEVSIGTDIGKIVSHEEAGIIVSNDLVSVIEKEKPDCLVDFTKGNEAPGILHQALAHRVPCVTGTTGLGESSIEELRKMTLQHETPVLIAPNFSLGAVLMMRFSRMAAEYYDHAEIIELHHDKKADAPSGTAIRTAQLMQSAKGPFKECEIRDEKIAHVRGGEQEGIHIHSIRLPGLLAHQEVLFGGEGELLTIRHDSTARSSFMPGVMLAVRKIKTLQGLVIGLENIMQWH